MHPSIAQVLRSTINKWDLMKLEIFHKAKDAFNSTKWMPIEWEDFHLFHTLSKIYKELHKLNIIKPNNPIENGIPIKTEFSTEEYQMDEKHRNV